MHQIELEMQNEELRRAQEELAASRDSYVDLYDFAPVGYLTIGEQGTVHKANLTAATLLGVERGNLVGWPFSRFIVAEDQDIYYQHHRRLPAGSQRETWELRLRKGDGSAFWAQLDCRPEADAEGRYQGCRVALTDIAARRQAEETLRESEEKYRNLFATTPDAIMVFDAETRQFIDANEACLHLYQYRREEFLQLRQTDITDQPDTSAASLEQTLEGQVARIPLRHHRKKDGTLFPVEISTGAFTSQGRRMVFDLVRDITRRKQLEQELVRSQRLRAVGELAAGASHNLNNILTSVLGPAQFLQQLTDDPRLLQEIDDIVTAGKRARDLVHQLHLSVRAQAEDHLQPVAVDEIVQQVVYMTRPRWKDESESKGIGIEVVTRLGDTPPVWGISSGLHDILTNLLFNAVDAMPEGGTIAIATRIVEEEVELTFGDTGSGMDEETQQRVFEPFFTTKMEVGTGLGLSTAYGAVSRWGGTIAVDSTPGQGTTFTIRLPFWIAPEPETRREEVVSAERTDGGRLLVVDDDQGVRHLLSRLLNERHQVTTAPDGRTALERFAPGRYDAILIDLGMPDISGDRVLRMVRQDDPAVGLVLVTGWELPADDPRRTAFDFHLQKPLADLQQVERVVDGAVGLGRSRVQRRN